MNPAPPNATPAPPVTPQSDPTQVAGWQGAWGGYAIEMRQVGHRFGEVVAINGISLAVPARTIVGIIGPSGSGKTTSIRTLTGAIQPEHGAVRVLGEDPRRFRRQTREQIGYMPQLFVLYPDLTARENVDFVASLFGLLGAARRRRVDEVLRLVELEEARDRRASQLSGGMQRRVALACALVHEPSLLILDEPTTGIDPLLRQRIWSELRRLRDSGVTVLLTTQYVSEAEYCDLVALISGSQLIAFAVPEDLRRQALGGDVIELVTRRPIDARSLQLTDGIVDIRQTGPRELLVVAQDAGRATPLVTDAIDAAGGEIEYSREYRPTFDEVFTALVTRHAQQYQPAQTGGSSSIEPLAPMRRPR
jgi:ABC-2 type transport system ATP-binding protein